MLTDSTSVLIARMNIPPAHASDRALWHLELGYEPGDEHAAQQVLIVETLFGDEDGDTYFDYDEDDTGSCSHCGGEGWAPVDDPLWDECDEFGYGPCGSCHGTGVLDCWDKDSPARIGELANWLTKPCPARTCPWQGKRPVDAGAMEGPDGKS